MAKAKTDALVDQPTPTAQGENIQSLDDFCRRLSLTEPRYGLISAFHFREKKKGTLRDLPSAYAKRYAAYIDPSKNEGDQ
ncbi:hypothetical protein D0Q53_20480 [Salmonella enterica]|nr:hypothetical protein [Salmonella enterica]EFF4796104.1 hypothetical protein [Escherichia coli]EBJ6658295.1 hypothetical protein [Salmonella enterica]EBL0923907.1 hypothetical protein [Salmonella enterica]ECO7324697.1 hypothetical protein [Salmonella enterica]